MPMKIGWKWVRDHPRFSLLVVYTGWKLLLLCLAFASPGLGYDTSTTLLYHDPEFSDITPRSRWARLVPGVGKLVRWDAVYFTQIGQRGYLWEQEWAFGWGFTKSLAVIGRGRS